MFIKAFNVIRHRTRRVVANFCRKSPVQLVRIANSAVGSEALIVVPEAIFVFRGGRRQLYFQQALKVVNNVQLVIVAMDVGRQGSLEWVDLAVGAQKQNGRLFQRKFFDVKTDFDANSWANCDHASRIESYSASGDRV